MDRIFYRFIVLCGVCFFYTTSFSQFNKKIDSLLAVLKTAKEDTTKANVLNNLSAFNKAIGNFDIAKKYAETAIALSEKLMFKKGIAIANYNIATINDNQGQYAEAIKQYSAAIKVGEQINHKRVVAYSYNGLGIIHDRHGRYADAHKNFQAALRISEEQNDKTGMASAYSNIGNIYSHQGNYPQALENYTHAIKINEQLGDDRTMAYAYGNIGVVHQMQGNYPEALRNYLACLKLSEKIGDKQSISIAYNQIGNIYKSQGKEDEALKSYLASLKLSEEQGDHDGISDAYCNIGGIYKSKENYPEALKYYNAAIKIRQKLGDLQGLASVLSNIGLIYADQHNYDESLEKQLECLQLTKQTGDKHGLATSYVNVGDIYRRQSQFPTAEKYFDSALLVAKRIGSKELMRNIYSGKALLDSSAGDYKGAYENYRLATTYRDSLMNKTNTEKIVKLQMQYEFDKKEDSLKFQQQLTDEKLKQQVLLSQQQQQSLALKENELTLINKESEIQRLAYLQTQSALAMEQAKRTENEKQLLINSQEKSLQQNKLNLQTAQLELQNKDLQQKRTQRNIFIAGSVALLLLLFFIFRNFQNQRKVNKFMQLSAEKQMVELQLENLRAQLNPHFMFNSLNAIQELIVTDKTELSQSYLERFAKLLRLLLENANQPFIPLRKELNFLELYLSLENLRIPDLKYSIQVDPQLNPEAIVTPNMMLQPYIENALWHGLQHKSGEKKLELHISRQNGNVNYEIKDNGVGRKKAGELRSLYRKEHRSKGMELLSRRFSLLSKEYGKDIKTEVNDIMENSSAAGTVVKISVPSSLTDSRQPSS